MVETPKVAAALIEMTGPSAGRVHDLPFGVHVVGRSRSATIHVDHDDVSRQHARLEVGPEGVRVHDLGSKNGITVDGARVESSVLLTHGQSLSFGAITFTVSHPSSQVAGTLLRAGETTITATRTAPHQAPQPGALLLPVVGVAVFGLLVALMLLS